MSSFSIVLPQSPVVPGEDGHLTDHDRIATGLLSLWQSVPQGVINVCAPPYSADPTGATDSTAAINAALAAAGGGAAFGVRVFVPAGSYLVSGTLAPPPFVRMVGETAVSLNLNTPPTTLSRIVVASGWAPASSTGVISFLSKTPGGWSTNWASGGLEDIFIDCSANTSSNLNGIYFDGPIYDAHLSRVCIYEAPHNGITASGVTESGITPTFPFHNRWDQVSAINCGNFGLSVVNFTDSSFVNCLPFGNANGAGWNIQNCSNSVWTACRAEWNEYGFSITGSTGTLTFTGCTTDQNSREGLLITSATGQSTQGGGVTWVGGKFHADGWAAASGHTFAVQVTGSTVPVTITGAVVESGQNVNNSGWFPATAVNIATSSYVLVTGCDLQGISAVWAWDGAGIVKRTGCIGMTGNPGSQVAVAVPDLPYASGRVPADFGLLEWNYDPLLAGGGTVMPTAGTGYILGVEVREPRLVTNLNMYLVSSGGTLTANECFAVLYNSSGTKIAATADQSSAWGSGSPKWVSMALVGGPYTLQPGFYAVQVFFNGTTGPSFLRAGLSGTAGAADPLVAAAAFTFAVNGTGLTAPPASVTLSSNSHTGAEQYCVGMS